MSATITIDAAGFKRAITSLAAFTPLTVRQVIRAEAGSILKACAGETKVATQAKTDTRSRLALMRKLELTGQHGVTVNAGVRGAFGAVFLRTSTGKWRRTHDPVFRPVAGMTGKKDHYFEYDWRLLQDVIAQVRGGLPSFLAAGRAAVGLARQSWVQIADDFGTPLESVPGGRISASGIVKARSALATTKRPYQNGQAQEYSANRTFVLTLINRLPYGKKIGLDAILARNIRYRTRFFEENLSRGVFDSLTKIARAYPGLRIQFGAN